ncbi:MAG: hypothetical protein HFE81_05175 [Bacilli bacterium]|nr:hypothetical protein [Bacilli bacterium]
MNKLKYLIIVLVALLIIPFGVFAEGEEETNTENNAEATAESTEEKKEVPLYFFRGEGCSHCAEAEEWFKSIEEEYGSYFEIKDYETWYDTENQALMERVAEARGESADGVPYIIVGNKSWNGFAEEYKEQIIDEIKTVYEEPEDERYDIMKLLTDEKKDEKKGSSDVVGLFVIIVVVGVIGYGIYQARKNTD